MDESLAGEKVSFEWLTASAPARNFDQPNIDIHPPAEPFIMSYAIHPRKIVEALENAGKIQVKFGSPEYQDYFYGLAKKAMEGPYPTTRVPYEGDADAAAVNIDVMVVFVLKKGTEEDCKKAAKTVTLPRDLEWMSEALEGPRIWRGRPD